MQQPDTNASMAGVVQRNIRALMEVRQREQRKRSLAERMADYVTAFAGSTYFVYLHALWFGVWLVLNSGAVEAIKPWDPYPFVMLAMIASVEAIFLSTFILITQNRMQQIADGRAELDLQISLLTEHELTRTVRMIDQVARKLGIVLDEADLAEAKQDIDPKQVAQHIERAEQEGLVNESSDTEENP